MPDYSKDTRDKACARLKSWGALVGAFNETKFRTELGTKPVTTISGQSLGNGYCMGVGLDWIRRVLQSKADRDPNYLTYSYDALVKKEDMKDRTLQQLKDRTENTSLRMAHAYYRQNEEIIWKGPKGGETKSVPTDEWKKVASDLDSDFDETRGKSGRTKTKKRFGKLDLVESKSKIYAKPGQWLSALTNTKTVLRAGHGVLAGFMEYGKRGHAIALWARRNSPTQSDSYYLFDPNFGVFSYNEENLETALQYLFWRDAEDTPYYADCSSLEKQEMIYMVFGPPNVV